MKLSIIMPCFNVGQTLARALDSIFMQKTNFDYEIIIVDDASTDSTSDIAHSYVIAHQNIRYLRNPENKGNAYSYYIGLNASLGDYFSVLDGDDYYTIPDKLQRQIDFLDHDSNEEYVGTATNYIIDLGNGMVSIPDRSTYQEFSYADFLTNHSGYYHTATYMYRNIFRGNVPKQIGDTLYRGDTPRTTFHLMYSGKKIKILDFVGSAYTYEFNGIWSSLNQKQQFEHQITYHTKHRENVETNFERAAADRLIKQNTDKLLLAQNDMRRYPSMSIDQALNAAAKIAEKFAFHQKDFVFKHAYFSSYLDTLCASLGYINRLHHEELVQKNINEENICIVINDLNPKGGGIFTEINELINIYHHKNVYLFITDITELPEETKNILKKHIHLTLIYPPVSLTEKLTWFQLQMSRIAPYRCYYYCSHRDAYSAALPHGNICENITLFSFDHGYLCGISNPYLHKIIAKRPVDYWMLKKTFADKVLFIPTWNDGAKDCEHTKYKPFYNHDNLITACGAARSYKINGKPPYRYIDLIIKLLKKTGGKHYHFGELPTEILEEIYTKLEHEHLSPTQFIHVPWSDNIPKALLENNVDIFIEPFPVVSYKLTLEVLSIGVPLIVHAGFTRIEIADFVPDNTLIWHDEFEFVNKLSSLTEETLAIMSQTARQYFISHHLTKTIQECLYTNTEIPLASPKSYPDNTLMDISFSLRLFGNNFKISIFDTFKQLEHTRISVRPNMQTNATVSNQIKSIRSSLIFKIFFILLLPLRSIIHLFSQISSYGLKVGLHNMKTANILFYRADDEKKELDILKKSYPFKIMNFFHHPVSTIQNNRKGIKKRVLEQMNQQSQILLSTQKILLEILQSQENLKKEFIRFHEQLNCDK